MGEGQKLTVKKTRFEKHPVVIGKQLHVRNPYYGPKPQYQRSEVLPDGDCQDDSDFTEEATAKFTIGAGTGRDGVKADITLTVTDETTAASIYLLFDQPLDLSWAKFIGMWMKSDAGDTYDPGDLYLYIFTKKGNYLYANRARAIDFFPISYNPGAALWTYKEFALEDFTVATGYEGDRLTEVWGIGWYSSTTPDTDNVIDIDMIEVYTHGTGKGWTMQGDGGPARGLIMSAPLVNGVTIRRGYGLSWEEAYGRINRNDAIETAFAGICVANPSRTRLAQDADAGDLAFYVIDASLFETGDVTLVEGDTPATTESRTITAVNRVTGKITISAVLTGDYTVAGKAFAFMEGNEEGTIRVDFLVNGPVNLEASATIVKGHDCSCSAVGSVLTVDGPAGEQDESIGKALLAASDDGEQLPVLLGIRGLAT